MKIRNQINKYIDDYSRKIRELNAKLPKEQQLFPVCVRPRDSELLIKARAEYFKEFQMGNTSPSMYNLVLVILFSIIIYNIKYMFLTHFSSTASWGCKHFASPEPGEKYKASTMLQAFCLRFDAGILKDGPMEVYGFVAVRDDCEPLRNYIFNHPREEAITLVSWICI